MTVIRRARQTAGITGDGDLESTLLGYILAARLPDEEPIMRWWANPDRTSLRVRAGPTHDDELSVG